MAVIDVKDAPISIVLSTNSTADTPWVEKTVYGGFRVWQVLFLVGGVLLLVGSYLHKGVQSSTIITN